MLVEEEDSRRAEAMRGAEESRRSRQRKKKHKASEGRCDKGGGGQDAGAHGNIVFGHQANKRSRQWPSSRGVPSTGGKGYFPNFHRHGVAYGVHGDEMGFRRPEKLLFSLCLNSKYQAWAGGTGRRQLSISHSPGLSWQKKRVTSPKSVCAVMIIIFRTRAEQEEAVLFFSLSSFQ